MKFIFVVGNTFNGILGDKEIAVGIRSNSHYRISCANKSSRNAYRFVTLKRLLGKLGRCVNEVRDNSNRFWYGRIPQLYSQYPLKGTFILSF